MITVLIASGIDSSGQAGMDADCATITSLGGTPRLVVTASTQQNAQTVQRVVATEKALLRNSCLAALSQKGEKVSAVKCGLLMDASLFKLFPQEIPWVVDPVMCHGGGGKRFLALSRWRRLFGETLPRYGAHIVLTPNSLEAEVLLGKSVRTHAEQFEAAKSLVAMGYRAVVVKGGHIHDDSSHVQDVLYDGQSWSLYRTKRIDKQHVRATGCAFASCLALMLGRGHSLKKSVRQSCSYLFEGLRKAENTTLSYRDGACAYDGKHVMLEHLVSRK